jgi:hypothetical protein
LANCEWAFLCDYAFKDQAGKTCLIGIFDRIYVTAVPTMHPQASLAMKIVGESNESAKLKVAILRPNAQPLSNTEGTVPLGPDGSGEVHFVLAALPIPDLGPYSIDIYIGDEIVRTLRFTVQKPDKQVAPH